MAAKRNNEKAAIILIAAMLFILLAGCYPAAKQEPGLQAEQISDQIFLLGELHGQESFFQKEFEIWSAYYNEYGFRDLFLEFPFYTAEYLNIWMQSDNDDILNMLYQDWEGSAARCPEELDFYRRIKEDCPETVFHGTDIGHQFYSTGERFLEYLSSTGQTDTEQYRLTQECIEQGKMFYRDYNWAYREDRMAENFIREVEALDGTNIMGIYGAAHVDVNAMNHLTAEVPSMACQIQEKYGDRLHTRDLCFLADGVDDPLPGEPYPNDPPQPDIVTIGEKTYSAQYFGRAALSASYPEYQYREFWLLEDAYSDFKNKPTPSDPVSYDGYPVEPEANQVYVVGYTKNDGSFTREFFRSDKTASGAVILKKIDTAG